MISNKDISVVIPAYNRVLEFDVLLHSISKLEVYPGEVLVFEDASPERESLRRTADKYNDIFKEIGISFKYVENDKNLGFDKNLRKCIESANTKWAFVIGNDDVLLPKAMKIVVDYINKNQKINLISRTFIRFDDVIEKPLGISSISPSDTVFSRATHSSKFIFRSCGFIGGLVVNVEFAKKLNTSEYDGGLYYQIYLASHAFCTSGIGYVSTPTVGGRADNPPLFGSADDESSLHIPGGYTAKGRAKMWSCVLNIAKNVGDYYKMDLVSDISDELKVRQSFHIFEMNTISSRKELMLLCKELINIRLFWHPIPVLFFSVNFLFGKKARIFYRLIRKLLQ